MTILLDSVILIDLLNDVEASALYLARVRAEAVVSVVTRTEVLTGANPKELSAALDILDLFPTLEITKNVADLAARLRRQHRWKLPDAYQAALAEAHHLKLATRNTEDFSPDRHDFVTIPYTITASPAS